MRLFLVLENSDRMRQKEVYYWSPQRGYIMYDWVEIPHDIGYERCVYTGLYIVGPYSFYTREG